MVDANINGEAISQFVEEIDVNAAAEWLGDTQTPEISVKYEGNVLTFTAEVWGEAREIVQQSIDFDWKILCGGTTDSYQSNKFNNRDRVFIKFKSPIPGYLAIYVLDSTNKEASCWLPYRSNTSGYFPVVAGKEYVLFDKAVDPYASPYRMVTSKPIEMDKVCSFSRPMPLQSAMTMWVTTSTQTRLALLTLKNGCSRQERTTKTWWLTKHNGSRLSMTKQKTITKIL